MEPTDTACNAHITKHTVTNPLGINAITFEELFDIADIQRLQDEFASATGVASLITHPDGTPITAPSQFVRLCSEIIRTTEKGCLNCFKSDAAIGRYNPDGPIVQPCLSGGLWDAGASITVGGHHIANWLIGQVRDATQNESKMRQYAKEIGVNEESFIEAFHEVPAMSHEQFTRIARVLFTLAKQLSTTAYQNIQQARFITERKLAFNKIKELEAKYRIVADNTYDWEYWLRPDRIAFEYVSPSCLRISGYDAEQFFDDPGLFTRIIHPDDRHLVERRLADQNEDQQSDELEFRIVRLDGSVRWICHVCQPVFGDSGQFLGSRGSNRDITARKQAEESLQKAHDKLEQRVRERTEKLTKANEDLQNEISERRKVEEALQESSVRFKMVVDSLDALVYVADMDTYQVLLVNSYGREIWGDLTGEICWERLQDGQTGPCSFCTNSRLLNASGEPVEPVVWEFQNTMTGRWFECRDQAIRWTDGRMVRMEIATDITVRKQAETEILSLNAELEQRVQQRTAQVEAVNKDLEAFTYTVSHDLRTPLAWIGGYSRLILRRYGDRLDEQPLQYLREICEGTKHMEILIDALLDFSHISYHELHRQPVNLSDLVRMVATELSRSESDRRVTFLIAEGVTEDVDPQLLLIVLKNLVGNAWKYTGKREDAVIEFGVMHRNGKRICFVRDNGVGFDMTQAEKLFLPFQRFHETSDFKGHGIGLATVRRIVMYHDGEVWAESSIGEGATFYFTLNAMSHGPL